METLIKSNKVDQMKYVVSCYLSDRTGRVISIGDFTMEQLEIAFVKACEWYNNVLPVPMAEQWGGTININIKHELATN